MHWRLWILAAISYFVSLALLGAVDRMSGHGASVIRMAVAAVLSGVHAALCAMQGFTFMAGTLWYCVILIAMGMIAYHCDIKLTVRFAAIHFVLGTFAHSLNNGGLWSGLIAGGMILLLCMVGWKFNGIDHRLVSVYIPSPMGAVSVRALRDSGNMLTDPLTGQGVLILSASVSRQLLGLTKVELEDPVKTVLSRTGLRLLPYHTVGGKGFLLAKKMDNVTIDNKTGSILVAFSPSEIGSNQGFQALTGGTV